MVTSRRDKVVLATVAPHTSCINVFYSSDGGYPYFWLLSLRDGENPRFGLLFRLAPSTHTPISHSSLTTILRIQRAGVQGLSTAAEAGHGAEKVAYRILDSDQAYIT